MNDDSLTYRITLIHGTGARGAPWTQDHSRLANALKAELDGAVTIERCDWSGWNTAGAREAGAGRLVAHLLAQGHKPLTERRFVVAHSHGGNIALYALRDPAAAAVVDGVVTLATPFLVARRRDLGPKGTENIVLALLVCAIASYLWLIDPRLTHSFGGFGDLAVMMLFTFAVLLVGLLLFARWNRLAEGVLASLRLAELPSRKLLIVRATGDEASAVLLFFQFLSFLAVRLFHSAINLYGALHRRFAAWSEHKIALIAVAIAGFLAIVGLVMLATALGLAITKGIAIAQVLLLSLLVVLPIFLLLGWVDTATGVFRFIASLALVPAALALAVFMLPIDWRVALANLLVDVTAETAPPGSWTMVQVVPERAEREQRAAPGLAHSIVYEDERALRAIVEWILQRAHDTDAAPPKFSGERGST